MRQSPMLNYPAAEFEARMADAARKVREAGLDCIMGTSKMVVCHLTGLRSVVWKSKVSTPGLLFLCADGRYGLVCSYGGIEAAMYSTCLEREDFYNARAVSLGLEGLQPGVTTEMELYKAIARQGYLNGSEHFTYMSLVSGPERALCVDCPASAAVIPDAPGTVIRVEGGAMRAELNATFTANIVVGGVQPEQKPA